MLAPNTVLQERYVIVRHLGQGGMGSVYLANDSRFRNTVALKETRFASGELRHAFEREAHLLRRLKHPALPGVIDYFEESSAAYLVMDFVPGEDLAALLTEGVRRGGLPSAQVVAAGIEILGALEYLHGHKPPILHRDVKPQNLKLTPAGRIVLLDFGLAKGSLAELSQTTGGSSVAAYTPHYAALEQIQGTGTTTQSDLYSLGATLYHLATGVMPADALRRAMATVACERDPLPMASDVNPAISKALAVVFHRAMALNPVERYATAADFRRALQAAALTDETTVHLGAPAAKRGDTVLEVGPLPPQARQGSQARPRRTGVALRLALAAVLGLAFVVVATGALAWAALSDSESDAVESRPSAPAPKPAAATKPVLLSGHTDQIFSIAWSTDGRMLASASYDKTVKIWDADGHLLSTLAHTGAPIDVVWDASGKHVATCDLDQGIQVWDVATAKPTLTYTGSLATAVSLSWQPAAYALIAGGHDGAVRMWDVDHGTGVQKTMTGHTGTVAEVAWGPDHQTIASADTDGGIRLWDGFTGNLRRVIGSHTGGVYALAWSPDGQRLATGGDDAQIVIWDATNGQKLRTLVGHAERIQEIAWSPDGKSLASCDKEDGSLLLWNADTGSLRETVVAPRGGVRTVAWSPDGATLAWACNDGMIRLRHDQ